MRDAEPPTDDAPERERPTIYYARCGWCGAYEGTVPATEPCAQDSDTGEYTGRHQFGIFEPAPQEAPAPEPVAWSANLGKFSKLFWDRRQAEEYAYDVRPLYTHPPKQTELTDDQILRVYNACQTGFGGVMWHRLPGEAQDDIMRTVRAALYIGHNRTHEEDE